MKTLSCTFFCLVAPLSALPQTPPALPAEIQTLIDASKDRKAAPVLVQREDPLTSAWLFAGKISGDEDTACKQKFRVIEAFLEEGRVTDAAAHAAEITDYRMQLAQMACAFAHLGKGQTEEADKLVEQIEKKLPELKPWQQAVLQVRLASFGAQSGRDEAWISQHIKPLRFEGDRQGASMLVLIGKMLRRQQFDDAALQAALSALPKKKSPVPEFIECALLLLRLAPPAGSHEEKEIMPALMSRFDDLIRASESYSGAAWLKLALFWDQRGEKQKATTALSRAQAQIGFHIEDAGSSYLHMASLHHLAGDQDAARPYFEAAEKRARSLLPMYRPSALSWLAACWHILGEEKRSTVLWQEALNEAATNANPRMRMIGGLDLCLAHHAVDEKIPPGLVADLQSLLDGSMRAEKGDP